MNNLKRTLITSLAIVAGVVVMLANPVQVFADCETEYGGGKTCIYNKSFEIDKKVRIKGKDSWKDKVTDVEKDDTVEFRIKIKNVGEVETDNMKMEDFLPDEMYRVGGAGLTEYFDNFKPGDTKEFVIRVKVESDEYDRDNFDKCIVNKAELRYGKKFEGADTATVCYSDEEPKELPRTGAESTAAMAVTGFGLTALGFLIKKSKR